MSRRTRIVIISEAVAKMTPIWAGFIVNLGYTRKQGAAFAEGYAQKLADLPPLGKLRALAAQDDSCMAAGLKAAGINEDEALQRANQ